MQGVNRQANLQSYVGKSVGRIAEEEGKHYIDAMLDLSVAGDLNVEFLGPEVEGRLTPRHRRTDQRQPLHRPRGVGWRRPHQVLQWWLIDHRLPVVAGAG